MTVISACEAQNLPFIGIVVFLLKQVGRKRQRAQSASLLSILKYRARDAGTGCLTGDLSATAAWFPANVLPDVIFTSARVRGESLVFSNVYHAGYGL